MFENFDSRKMQVAGCSIALFIGGSGPGLLLLHGFPETRHAWHKIASRLAEHYTVVIPDLPGYGDATGPERDAAHTNYSKRVLGNILHEMMVDAGFPQYAIAGHDRGARVAYRMALDHPAAVTALALLDIVPTSDMMERLNYETAVQMENWFFLSQPAPLPEKLIAADPAFYFNHIMDSWAANPGAVTPEAKAAYLRCFQQPRVIETICEEYRATLYDIVHDQADRLNNHRITCSVLLLWAANGFATRFGDPVAIWKSWADNVSGQALPCGHFLMEECPEEVLQSLKQFYLSNVPAGT